MSMAAGAKSTSTKGRTRRARDSLSREIIVAAAEKVAQRDGIDGLTFQAIGDELDAHPTSIYRHFRDKHELLLALIDTLRARSYTDAFKATDDWIADLRTHARSIHDHYMRYPEFALLMATRRPTDASSLEFALDALLRGGFPPAEAALYSRALGTLARSASSIEAAIQALPVETRTADELAWQVDARRLDPERFPNVTRVGADLPEVSDPRAWETALELMLEGLARRAEELRTS